MASDKAAQPAGPVQDGGEAKGWGVSGQLEADLAADDAPGDRAPGEDMRARQEKLIDEAVEETFPASDPIAPKHITK